MDNRLKRFLSLALAIIMVIGLMPANVVFATENEGNAPDGNEPIVVAEEPTAEPTEPVVAAATHAEGCMLDANHTGDCKIKCDKKTECTLEKGHSDVCMNGDTILVDVSDVFSEKGLRAAIGTGGNIKITEDIVLHGALTIGSTVTLDLNGNSITVVAAEENGTAPAYALINNGTLTITDTATGGSVSGVYNNEGKVLNIQGGTFTAAGSNKYAVFNEGTANITGGKFLADGGYALGNDANMTVKDADVEGAYNTHTLTIESGDFTSSGKDKHAVNSNAGELKIKGGEFDNNTDGTATIKVSSNATISGGTFDTDANSLALQLEGSANVTISGGNINDGIAAPSGTTLIINGGSFTYSKDFSDSVAGTVTVNGGTFTEANSQKLATRYAAENKIIKFDDAEMVKSGDNAVSLVVAKIETNGETVAYPSLETAVDGAKTGDEIKLVSNAELEEFILIKKDLAITLDLNGKAVTADFGNNYGAIEIQAGGSLTIKDSSAEKTGSITNTAAEGHALLNFGSLTVYGGTITGNYALYNGSYENGTATAILYGGTFNADARFYSVINCSNMTIAGATVNDYLSTSGIFEMTDGEVNYLVAGGANAAVESGIKTEISGGEIGCLDACDAKGTLHGNVVTIKGDAEVEIVKAGKHESVDDPSTVKIEAGTIGSVSAYVFDDSNIEEPVVGGPISVTGGTFDSNPVDYVDANYEVVEQKTENGVVYSYTVQLKKVVLQNPAEPSFPNAFFTDIKGNKMIKEEVENNTGYTLFITPQSIVTKGTQTSRIAYSVTPQKLNGEPVPAPGGTITFNLPIPGTKPTHITHVNVYHSDNLNDLYSESKKLEDEYEIEEYTDAEGKKWYYVTLASNKFSYYGIELIDINTATDVARIGVKGYETVQDAVYAVQDGETIYLLDEPQNYSYGNVAIDLNVGKSFTIDGQGKDWQNDVKGTSTITITGTSPAGKKVTIKNIKFETVSKNSGNYIAITGNNSGKTNVEILDCVFEDDTVRNLTAIYTSGTNGVTVKGGSGDNLKAFLVNERGQNLTVEGVTVTNSVVGLELGAVRDVTVKGVNITANYGTYGISMEASVDNLAKFDGCTITADLPIMVYGKENPGTNEAPTAHGHITFSGASQMNGGVVSGGRTYWMILGNEKYTSKSSGTDPNALSTSGRIVITLSGTGLNGEGINYKHKDGNKYYTVMPEGKMEPGVVFDDAVAGDSRVSFDITGLVASERIVIKLYDSENAVIAESNMRNGGYLYLSALTGVVEIDNNRYSNSWDTAWLTDEECPTYRNIPTKAELVVDGKVLAEVPVYMYQQVPTATKRAWTDVEGVGNMTLTTGNKTEWKHSLAEAFEAVEAGKTGTVTLFEDNDAVLFAAGEVTGGKTITITGKAKFDWGKNWLFIGRGENSSGDGTLIFDGAVIEAVDSKVSNGAVGIHVSGKESGAANKNDGTLQIIGGSNIEVDYVVNRNQVLLDEGSTLTIKYGFYHHGRPETETPDAKNATAVMDVMNGSTLEIQNTAVAAILGEEGYGELNVNNATFTCDADLAIVDKIGTELNVSGTSTLNIKKVTGKPINLLDEATVRNSSIGGNARIQGTAEKPAGVTFTGENAIGDLELVDGKVYINTESVLTANKIIKETDDAFEIIIDATNLVDEDGVTVINLNGDAESKAAMNTNKVLVKDDKAAKKVADDGDVIVYFEAYIDENKNGKLDIGEGYSTVEKAIAAATAGDKVVLLAKANVAAAVEINKNIVLDLNNKEIYGERTYISVLKVTASGATVKNGRINATYSNNTGIEVAAGAAVEVIGVQVDGNVAGIKASGSVTIGEDAAVTARYSSPAVIAEKTAAVTVDGGTIDNGDRCAIELNDSASVTINDGDVIGAPAIRVYGGTLTVNGGNVTRKHSSANAIVTSSDGETENVVSAVVINNGEIDGAIIAEDVAADAVVPKGYKVSVTIKGGNFTNSNLDWDYVDEDYGSIAVSRANAEVPTTFNYFVPFEMIAPDFICQKVKDSNPVKYEIVPYEHVRIFMDSADQDVDEAGNRIERVIPESDIYVDGEAYKVQPGKVILVDKEMAKTSAMFITTYGYETKDNDDKQDDYPNAMYVWYAVGENKVGDIYTSYKVTRVAELDNFFQYNGTSIRVGASNNGIRFFSSVDVTDANKLMAGTLITDTEHPLSDAIMTQTGTEFWKTNKLRSEVYGGAAGKSFRVFQQAGGRIWFTGVLVGLDTDGKTIVDPIYSRPYAEIEIGNHKATLYGGTLERSIYYVAMQNKDGVFAQGSVHDKFVEGLIADGDAYLDSLNNNSNNGSAGTQAPENGQ